ncbi:MAG: host attachment protein, partial [Proteobacteria bacterium]|nr:host attachment protein [Pseudomonadota bacterium]
FMGEVAEAAGKVCRQRGLEAVVVAAPSQLIGVLRREMEARAPVIGAVRKDLTKTPNAELGAWLNTIFYAPNPAP